MRTALTFCSLIALSALGLSSAAIAEDTSGYSLRASASLWWAMPAGRPSGAPAAGDLSDVDNAAALLVQGAVKLPVPLLPTIAVGGYAWSSDNATTDVKAKELWATASWGFSALDSVGFGLGFGAHACQLDIEPAAVGSTRFDHDDIIPVVVASVWVKPPLLGLDLTAGIHYGALGERRLVTAQAAATWTAFGPLGITGGYRYQHVEQGSEGEGELTLQGPFLGLGLAF